MAASAGARPSQGCDNVTPPPGRCEAWCGRSAAPPSRPCGTPRLAASVSPTAVRRGDLAGVALQARPRRAGAVATRRSCAACAACACGRVDQRQRQRGAAAAPHAVCTPPMTDIRSGVADVERSPGARAGAPRGRVAGTAGGCEARRGGIDMQCCKCMGTPEGAPPLNALASAVGYATPFGWWFDGGVCQRRPHAAISAL